MQWYHVTFLLVWPHLLRQGERTSYHKWLMCHTPIKNKHYKNDAATDRFSFTTYTKHLQRKLWLAFLFNTQGFILLENFLFFKEYFLWMQFIDVQSGRKWRTASNPGKNVSVFAETTGYHIMLMWKMWIIIQIVYDLIATIVGRDTCFVLVMFPCALNLLPPGQRYYGHFML